MVKAYLTILYLISFVYAARWAEFGNLTHSSHLYGATNDNYNEFHYGYCAETDKPGNYLIYRDVNPANGKYRSSVFTLQGTCKAVQVVSEEKTIHSVYQVTRLCSGAYACSDIYYKDSVDLGKTWNKEILIEESSSDVVYRYDPLVVYNASKAKVWVAYKSLGKANPTAIKVASKMIHETKFSNYVTVAITNQSTILPGGFAFTRTVDKDLKSKLHLFWEVKDPNPNYMHNIYYSNSEDGLSWSQPIIIAETDLYDHNSPFSVTKHGAEVYLVFVRNDGAMRGIWMTHTKDNGENWSNAQRLSRVDDYVSITTQVCEIKGQKRLYILAQDPILDKATDAFGYKDLNEGHMLWLGNPYASELDDCFNPRIVCNNALIWITCKARTGKQTYQLLYKNPG